MIHAPARPSHEGRAPPDRAPDAFRMAGKAAILAAIRDQTVFRGAHLSFRFVSLPLLLVATGCTTALPGGVESDIAQPQAEVSPGIDDDSTCWEEADESDGTEARQASTGEHRTTRFETPCPDDLPPDFGASLQRALAARDLYDGAVTGRMDAATRAAIRRYQAPEGPDSGTLSLAAARRLGLVAIELPEGAE